MTCQPKTFRRHAAGCDSVLINIAGYIVGEEIKQLNLIIQVRLCCCAHVRASMLVLRPQHPLAVCSLLLCVQTHSFGIVITPHYRVKRRERCCTTHNCWALFSTQSPCRNYVQEHKTTLHKHMTTSALQNRLKLA